MNKQTHLKSLWVLLGIGLLLLSAAAQERPQNPTPPYPYVAEDITFDSRADGIKLAGTLTFPKEGGPFPAAVLISGSGAHDRDETIFDHRPFLVLADHLTRHGIAVLRFDDRGAGKSGGDYMSATISDFAEDVGGAVDYLQSREEIDPHKIGLIGHSEGGVIGPMAASRSEGIAFMVLMGAPGFPVYQNLLLAEIIQGKAAGQSEESTQKMNKMRSRIFDIIREELDNEKAEEKIRRVIDETYENLPAPVRKRLGDRLRIYLINKMRVLLFYDPVPALKKIDCPVLSIHGEKDLQALSKENREAIEKALLDSGHQDHTIIELEGLNHLLQTAKTGSLTEYAKIAETIAPKALEVIAGWIRARFVEH